MRPVIFSKNTIQSLYKSGRSMAEIAKSLNCSLHKVVYWMKRYDIHRRSHSDAAYIKQNPDGDPFKIQKDTSGFLYGLGLGIYWGEGTKVTPHVLRVTNTDPSIIRTFRTFLLSICGLRIDKIRYSIVAFNDSNTSTVRAYWANQLKISHEKFGKIVQIPPQGKGSYKRKSKFGVCSITVSNIKLKKWIMEEIESIGKTLVV